MDPQHHATIVDKLMQYRGKIPKTGHLADLKAKWTCDLFRDQLDDFILLIEEFAKLEDKGLIR